MVAHEFDCVRLHEEDVGGLVAKQLIWSLAVLSFAGVSWGAEHRSSAARGCSTTWRQNSCACRWSCLAVCESVGCMHHHTLVFSEFRFLNQEPKPSRKHPDKKWGVMSRCNYWENDILYLCIVNHNFHMALAMLYPGLLGRPGGQACCAGLKGCRAAPHTDSIS